MNPENLICVRREPFGALSDGRSVERVVLIGRGISAAILTYGASLQSLVAPDRNGSLADIVLGFSAIEDYELDRSYFGCTVGRYANRLSCARFAINGVQYDVTANEGVHTLHGGVGFGKRLWSISSIENEPPAVTLRLISPSGEDGFPGTLSVEARFSISSPDTLSIEYRATTDAATVVNLTLHPYFNLAGDHVPIPAIDQLLTINATRFTPVDSALIPTGECTAVDGTMFDFQRPKAPGLGIGQTNDPQIAIGAGYDHNFIVNGRRGFFRSMATLRDPASGRLLEVFSDQPGLQFYSGNRLDGTVVGKGGHRYHRGDAIVLEPQLFPDTPNRPEFGHAYLLPGKHYRHCLAYRCTTDREEFL